MSDELQQVATQAGTGGAIGGVAGIARMMIFGQPGGVAAWISSTVAGVVVGVGSWLVLLDTKAWDFNPPEGVKITACIVFAMFAKDLLMGLASLGSGFAQNPIGLVKSVWDAIRGK